MASKQVKFLVILRLDSAVIIELPFFRGYTGCYSDPRHSTNLNVHYYYGEKLKSGKMCWNVNNETEDSYTNYLLTTSTINPD